MTTTSVDLPATLLDDIDREVKRGGYKSRSELVRDAVLRLMEDRHRENRVMSDAMKDDIREARSQKGENGEQPISELL